MNRDGEPTRGRRPPADRHDPTPAAGGAVALATLHALPDAIVHVDGGGRVRFLNRSAEHLCGWVMDDADGQPLEEVFRLVDMRSGTPVKIPADPLRTDLQDLRDHADLAIIDRDGRQQAVELTGTGHLNPGEAGESGLILAFREISERRRLTRRISYMARHDPLTGLVNRFEFERALRSALREAVTQQRTHALFCFDLDEFKEVNDSHGHEAGDELLRQLGDLLSHSLRESDIVARIGGDEFAALLPDTDGDAALAAATNLADTVEHFRFTWGRKTFRLRVSIGLVLLDGQSDDPAEVMRMADTACYEAKAAGGGQTCVHRPGQDPDSHRRERTDWKRRLRDALDRDSFRLDRQRIIPVAAESDRNHWEVFVRLADGRDLPPASFFPAAERFNLRNEIDHWVVNAALMRIANGQDGDADIVSINISDATIGDPDFPAFVTTTCKRLGVPGSRLCFEITEDSVMRRFSQASRFVQHLRTIGAQIALDDFGSGISSFACLKRLPVDFIKIDGMYVREVLQDPVNQTIIEAIRELAAITGARTVAESVESNAVLECLKAIGIDYAQGYALHRPEPWS